MAGLGAGHQRGLGGAQGISRGDRILQQANVMSGQAGDHHGLGDDDTHAGLKPGQVGGGQLAEFRVVVFRDHHPVGFGKRVDRFRHRFAVVDDGVAVVIEYGCFDQFDAAGPAPWTARVLAGDHRVQQQFVEHVLQGDEVVDDAHVVGVAQHGDGHHAQRVGHPLDHVETRCGCAGCVGAEVLDLVGQIHPCLGGGFGADPFDPGHDLRGHRVALHGHLSGRLNGGAGLAAGIGPHQDRAVAIEQGALVGGGRKLVEIGALEQRPCVGVSVHPGDA
nr:hypothetical protein [Mycolicibacterium elephantis]